MNFTLFTLVLLSFSALSLSFKPHLPPTRGPALSVPVEVVIKGGDFDGQTTLVTIDVQVSQTDKDATETAAEFSDTRAQKFVSKVDKCFIAGCSSCLVNFKEKQAIKCARCLPGHVLYKAVMQGNVINGVTVPNDYSDTVTDICLPTISVVVNKDKQSKSLKESISHLARIDSKRILVGTAQDREGGGGKEKTDVSVAFGQSPPAKFWRAFDVIQAAVMGKAGIVLEAGIKSVYIHPKADESFRFPRAKLAKVDANARQEVRSMLDWALHDNSLIEDQDTEGESSEVMMKKRDLSRSKREAIIDSSLIISMTKTCPEGHDDDATVTEGANFVDESHFCSLASKTDDTVNGHPTWKATYSFDDSFSDSASIETEYIFTVEAVSDSSPTAWKWTFTRTVTTEEPDMKTVTGPDLLDSEVSVNTGENPWDVEFARGFIGLRIIYYFSNSCPDDACSPYFARTGRDNLLYIKPGVNSLSNAITLIDTDTWEVKVDGVVTEYLYGSSPLLATSSNGGICATEACSASTDPTLSCFGTMEVGTTYAIEYPDYTAYASCSADDFTINPIVDCQGTEYCFPEDSLVTMADGSTKAIQDISLGDQVMTLDQSSGQMVSSQIYGFAHHEKEAKGISYLVIECEDQSKISLSANHFIPRFEGEERTFVPARKIEVGDLLQTCTGKGDCNKSRVKSVEVEKKNGFFAPLTETGTLVVDGVVASVYAEYGGNASAEMMHTFSTFLLVLPTKMINALYPEADPSNSANQLHPVAWFLSSTCLAAEWLGKKLAFSFQGLSLLVRS